MELNFKMLGYRISNRRRKLNMTQEEKEKKVNVTSKHISAIETGRSKTSVELLYDIATCLDVTLDYFAFGVVKKTKIEEISEYLRECSDDEIELIKVMIKAIADNHNNTK